MPDNYEGLNISTRQGEGAANVLSWGNLDRATNQLYQEQKQREARGYNEYLAGEEQLQKELGTVRSADIENAVSLYNKRKRTKQQLLFDESIKKDAVAYAKKQQELQLQDTELRKLVFGSKELKESDKEIQELKKSNPAFFDQNKIGLHTKDINDTLANRIKNNRIDASAYAYNGIKADKLQSIEKTAMGTPKNVPFGAEVKHGDIQFKQDYISKGSSPLDFANSFYNGLVSEKDGGQSAIKLLSDTPLEQTKEIVNRFTDIPNPEFEEKWGITKAQLTNGIPDNNPVAQYVLLKTMKYATDNLPKIVDTKYRIDPDLQFKRNEKSKKAAADLSFSRSLIKIGENNNQNTLNPQLGVDYIYNNGQETPLAFSVKKGGERVTGRIVTLPADIEDDIYDKLRGNVVRPTYTIMSNDKKKLYLAYDDGTGATDYDKSRTIDIPTGLIPLIGKNYGGVGWTKKNLFTDKADALPIEPIKPPENKKEVGKGGISQKKYTATGPKGEKIYSTDGKTWFTIDGKKI